MASLQAGSPSDPSPSPTPPRPGWSNRGRLVVGFPVVLACSMAVYAGYRNWPEFQARTYCSALSHVRQDAFAAPIIRRLADGSWGKRRVNYALRRVGNGDQWLDYWLLSGPLTSDWDIDLDRWELAIANWDECLADEILVDAELRRIWLHWIKFWYSQHDWKLGLERSAPIRFGGIRPIWAVTHLLLSGKREQLEVKSLKDLEVQWPKVDAWFRENLPYLRWDEAVDGFVVDDDLRASGESVPEEERYPTAPEAPLPYWTGSLPFE